MKHPKWAAFSVLCFIVLLCQAGDQIYLPAPIHAIEGGTTCLDSNTGNSCDRPLCSEGQVRVWIDDKPTCSSLTATVPSDYVIKLPEPIEYYTLYAKTYGGTVTLIQGLPKATCEYTMNRLLGRPATKSERDKEKEDRAREDKRYNECFSRKRKKNEFVTCGQFSTITSIGPGSIETAECFK